VELLGEYVAFGRAAQGWLRSRGLTQYVPAAHEEYADVIQARAESGSLYAVWEDGEVVGFFHLEQVPPRWWAADGEAALYLGGIVVSPRARGRGVGRRIIGWCVAEAGRLARRFVRLDCHADNAWLCK
jgi:GNAT superfamily N-acetyltransferase